MEEEYELDKVFVFNAQRTANVWIEDQKSTEALTEGVEYNLMVNVGMKGADAISLVDPSFLQKIGEKSDGIEITVSISGESFEIPTNTETLFLPKEGDSNPIRFRIIPKVYGIHKLWLYFYYKLNLIMILSTPLEIKKQISGIMTSFENAF